MTKKAKKASTRSFRLKISGKAVGGVSLDMSGPCSEEQANALNYASLLDCHRWTFEMPDAPGRYWWRAKEEDGYAYGICLIRKAILDPFDDSEEGWEMSMVNIITMFSPSRLAANERTGRGWGLGRGGNVTYNYEWWPQPLLSPPGIPMGVDR